MTSIVTGGAGFIGSALVRHLINSTNDKVVVVDKLTYAGSLDSLVDVSKNARFRFVQADIADAQAIAKVFAEENPDTIYHLAAESHVDRSIDGPAEFVQTNIVGTYTLLQETLRIWDKYSDAKKKDFRFVHVSTDEVFGSLGRDGAFTETTPYSPRSPYSSSKASSDHLARAWFHTYKLPVTVTNCSNNYGAFQFPEKLIPVVILNALEGNPIPVYGTGENVRDWIYVEDHVKGLVAARQKGVAGETYCLGGQSEQTNLELVKMICSLLDELKPGKASYSEQITFVKDRPGHDHRYAIDISKARKELQWTPSETLRSGLRKTVEWYFGKLDWCKKYSHQQHDKRLGLRGAK